MGPNTEKRVYKIVYYAEGFDGLECAEYVYPENLNKVLHRLVSDYSNIIRISKTYSFGKTIATK
jgi:hypothetical protein